MGLHAGSWAATLFVCPTKQLQAFLLQPTVFPVNPSLLHPFLLLVLSLQTAVGSFARSVLPLLLDLLTVSTLQPLAASAKNQLLPSVLRRVSPRCSFAFLVAALHRLLSPSAPPSGVFVAEEQPQGASGRCCLSLEVFSMLRSPPPPRCGEAFELAVRYHEVFLGNEGASAPSSLEKAEELLQLHCSGAMSEEPLQQQTFGNRVGETRAENEPWGSRDVRWRWLFWGVTCPVVGSARSCARQLLQLLHQQQQQWQPQRQQVVGVTAAEQRTAWSSFIQLLEALDDFSQHLIKQQQQTFRSLCSVVAKAVLQQDSIQADMCPLSVQPLWVEAVLLRGFAHDNALLSCSFLLSFMSLCCGGGPRDPAAPHGAPLLRCVTMPFVLEAIVPHMGVPSFFCRSNDCRQAEATVQRFLQQRLSLEATQQHQQRDDSRVPCVTSYLRAIGDHCYTYTPLRIFLDALLLPGGTFSAIQQQQQQTQHQQEVFVDCVTRLMAVIATTPHSVREGLYERLLRLVAVHAPPGSLSLPVLGCLLAALPHCFFARQLREASDCCTNARGTSSSCRSKEETGETETSPAMLHLLLAAFPSLNAFADAVKQLLQRNLLGGSGVGAEKEDHKQQQQAAFELARLVAAATMVPHSEIPRVQHTPLSVLV